MDELLAALEDMDEFAGAELEETDETGAPLDDETATELDVELGALLLAGVEDFLLPPPLPPPQATRLITIADNSPC